MYDLLDLFKFRQSNQITIYFLKPMDGIKQPQVALHHHEVLHLLRIQLGPIGGDHIAGRETPAQISMKQLALERPS